MSASTKASKKVSRRGQTPLQSDTSAVKVKSSHRRQGSSNRLAYLNKLSRGEVEAESSSSSDSEASVGYEEAVAEEAVDAATSQPSETETNEISSRLSIQDLDWSKIKAIDIFVIMSSFLTTSGKLKNVTVYLSKFGEERLEVENRYGPQTGNGSAMPVIDTGASIDVDESKELNESDAEQDLIRSYEKSRLRYYFAVCEFDSASVANQVYEECDSYELEKSSVQLNLRCVCDCLVYFHELVGLVLSLIHWRSTDLFGMPMITAPLCQAVRF